MRRLACLFVLWALPALAAPAFGQAARSRAGTVAPAPDYEAALTAILQQVATPAGRVHYDRLRGPLRDDFRRVLKAVETYDPARLTTQAARLAFWINAYNVQMLQHIVDHPEAGDLVAEGYADAFFKTPVLTAGLAVTLDEIEHVILRGRPGPARLRPYRLARLDPRIHVGLHCAAVSCPRLRAAAFTAGTVDSLLAAALRDFAGSPAHLRREDGRFVLSALLQWFGSDFDRPGRPGGDYLLRHMAPDRPDYAALRALLQGRPLATLPARPDVTFVYDWQVNRATR